MKVVELPGVPEGGDVVDWIDGHGEAVEPDELRRQIEALADAAKPIDVAAKRAVVVPELVRLADVNPQPVRWLWPGRIPVGKLTLVAGDPGLGKSLLTLDIAARVSRGAAWPDDRDSAAPLGSVILLSAEDDVADTIRPRLDAAEADVSRVVALTGVRGRDDSGDYARAVDLSTDLQYIDAAITNVPDCRLVVIDPLTAYLGHADSHKNAEIRALLAPLAELAGRRGVAVVAVTHLRKSAGPAVYRSIGSLAFTAAARAVWAVGKDKADAERRLFLPVKNNLAPDGLGLAYGIVDAGNVPCVAWSPEPVEITADQALAGDEGGGQCGATAEAAEWLRALLADGPVEGKQVKQRARADGIAARTLDRGKAKLGVVAGPDGFGGPWVWRLPKRQCAPVSSECAKPETLAHSGETGALPDHWGGR